jgi:hypothetical protein
VLANARSQTAVRHGEIVHRDAIVDGGRPPAIFEHAGSADPEPPLRRSIHPENSVGA